MINTLAAYPNTLPSPSTGIINVAIIPLIAASAPAVRTIDLEDTLLSRLIMLTVDVVVCNTNSNISNNIPDKVDSRHTTDSTSLPMRFAICFADMYI